MANLFFDTETTGKADFNALPSASHQPDMVQLGMILKDETRVYACIDLLVCPEVPVEPKAEEVHGISTVMAQRYGVPRRVATAMFMNLMYKAECIVAHNIDFDLRIMQTAMLREGISPEKLLAKSRFCTMKTSTDICQIPSPHKPGKFKWPTMQEAYKFLVDPNGFDGAHDAMADVTACSAVYYKILARQAA